MKNWLGIIFFSNSDRQLISKKKGDEPPGRNQRTTGTETNQTKPETEHQPGRTHTTQPTKRETTKAKALLARTRSKTAPADRPRKRTHRRTQQPRTATTRQSQTDNATERNGHARERRTRTNRKRRTRHEKNPPKEKQRFLCFTGVGMSQGLDSFCT